jgi:ribonuclease P protein component
MILDEANLSTSQPAPVSDPRLFEPDEHPGRPSGLETPARQGPKTPLGLRVQGASLSLTPFEPRPGNLSQTITRQGTARFGKAERLRRRREFLRVQATGKRLYTPHFGVWLAPGAGGRPRLGLVVTRRLGKAVRRNRVKRLLREFFRRHKAELPPQDLIILARPGASTLTYQQVEMELSRVLLARAGMAKND